MTKRFWTSGVLAILAMAAIIPPANARDFRAGARTSVNQASFNRNTNINRNANVNVNRNANVNVNRNVNVNVDNHYHDNWYDDHPVATAAAVTAAVSITAAAIGSVVRSIPPSCTAVIANGVTYQQCGSTWYQPQYVGSQVQYVVVNAP